MEPRIIERAEHPISRRNIDSNVLRILYRLANAGHVAYLVGGSVRDLMLGRRPKDFDVATSAHPQQVRELFRNSRMIGRRFKLVHVFFGPHNIEVATFRRQAEAVAESEDPLIRIDNTFGTAEEDAFRRDFTVNALFYDPQTFQVIDYAGGVDDLNARLIRTIGDPELRMREDPVRMMRAVRFAAKLGFGIEPATRAAMERHHADLLKSSVPRLVEETYRTLGQVEAARALVLLTELGLLELMLPFLFEHVRSTPEGFTHAPTTRNLAALGRALASGEQPGHATILAALFLDFRRVTESRDGHLSGLGARFDLLAELRARGFARGDTEHMRLLLDGFELCATPSRRTRRLMRRPYFADARALFEMLAPTYELDIAPLARLVADPEGFFNPQPQLPANGQPRPGKRRRRRRRRRGHSRSAMHAAAPADAARDGAAAPHESLPAP
ncbi:MAG TPA: polynucleotide adenylyltransferase PcnB, partial [Candidatus Binataceae bacterium]|nr:polynucleotide adenylyltransferase PcnB [Candidatus Binataceae bacterium]